MEKISIFDDLFDRGRSGNVDDLLALILPAEPPTPNSPTAINLLANFLTARLANQDWSPAEVAQRLKVEPEFVQGLLNGSLPEAKLTDDLLVRLAAAIEYEPNMLRILLGREFERTVRDTVPDEPVAQKVDADFEEDPEVVFEVFQEAIEEHLDHLTVLLEQLQQRYHENAHQNTHRLRQQEYFIKQVVMSLTRHDFDVRIIEILVENLKAVDADGSFSSGNHRPHRDIKRIIHYIEENIT